MIRRRDVQERLIVLIFLFAAGIQAFLLARRPELIPSAGDDPFSRLFGSAKEILGDLAFLKSDVYFHHGVPARFRQHETGAGGAEKSVVEALRAEEPKDWIARLRGKVAFEGHYELGRDEEQEIVPWLAWAVSLDPHNEQAVLTTAYWLGRHFDKADAAAAILEKGARDIPDSWEIQYELGKIQFKKKDFASAAGRFREAEEKHGPIAPEDRPLMREMRYYRGECEAAVGNGAAALEAYRGALQFFAEDENMPLKSKILDKIRALEGHAA